jgi:hypothetical protein
MFRRKKLTSFCDADAVFERRMQYFSDRQEKMVSNSCSMEGKPVSLPCSGKKLLMASGD